MQLASLLLMLSTVAQTSELTATQNAKPLLHEHPTLLAMLDRNNELRRSVGLGPQRINAVLTQAAQNHARFMANTGGFSHYSNGGPNGRALRFGFLGNVRENIALGQRNVLTAFRSWRYSSGHWASITSDASEVGFGYAISKGGTPYWVAVYGYPPAARKESVEGSAADTNTTNLAVQSNATSGNPSRSGNYDRPRPILRLFRR